MLAIQRQRCTKILCPKHPEFYTPLALKCHKGQHLPALDVYTNRSPTHHGAPIPQKEDALMPAENLNAMAGLRNCKLGCFVSCTFGSESFSSSLLNSPCCSNTSVKCIHRDMGCIFLGGSRCLSFVASTCLQSLCLVPKTLSL